MKIIKRKELEDMLNYVKDSLMSINNLLDERDYDAGVCYAVETLEDLATNLEIYLKKKIKKE